jgi:hypothetical protein
MTRTMNIYRIHFYPEAPREDLHGCIVDLLMLMHEEGAWPKILHETGMSKNAALKKSFDLTCRDAVAREMTKVVNERLWPKLAIKGYWSEGLEPADRFVMRFSSNARAFSWPNMMFVEITRRFEQEFLLSISSLGQATTVPFVVVQLDNTTSEITRISDGNGTWYEGTGSSQGFSRLSSMVKTAI